MSRENGRHANTFWYDNERLFGSPDLFCGSLLRKGEEFAYRGTSCTRKRNLRKRIGFNPCVFLIQEKGTDQILLPFSEFKKTSEETPTDRILCVQEKNGLVSGSRAFLRILSTEGRGVRLCRAHSQPKAPKGSLTPPPIMELACRIHVGGSEGAGELTQ